MQGAAVEDRRGEEEEDATAGGPEEENQTSEAEGLLVSGWWGIVAPLEGELGTELERRQAAAALEALKLPPRCGRRLQSRSGASAPGFVVKKLQSGCHAETAGLFSLV